MEKEVTGSGDSGGRPAREKIPDVAVSRQGVNHAGRNEEADHPHDPVDRELLSGPIGGLASCDRKSPILVAAEREQLRNNGGDPARVQIPKMPILRKTEHYHSCQYQASYAYRAELQ